MSFYTAQMKLMRMDAERYRWIRQHSYIEVNCNSPRVDGWHPEKLDAAIDAAMSAQQAEPAGREL